jgi:hypothetical protein
LNLFGAALYLYDASSLWGDQGMPGPGDGLYWIIAVAPVLIVFGIVNLVTLVHLVRTRRRAPMPRFAAFAIVACVWISAVGLDGHQKASEICTGTCLTG